MNLTRDFTEDFYAMTAGLRPSYDGPPYAFSRYADGERAIMCEDCCHNAKSDGWRWCGRDALDSPLPKMLSESLTIGASLENYHVGVSSASHHPNAHKWYMKTLRKAGVDLSSVTFAELFIFSNWWRFKQVKIDGCCIVASKNGNVTVPADPRSTEWPNRLRCLVSYLIDYVTPSPILVSAGPWASVLIAEYWKATTDRQRSVIIDVGSAIDPEFKGRRTRFYHNQRHATANLAPVFR